MHRVRILNQVYIRHISCVHHTAEACIFTEYRLRRCSARKARHRLQIHDLSEDEEEGGVENKEEDEEHKRQETEAVLFSDSLSCKCKQYCNS